MIAVIGIVAILGIFFGFIMTPAQIAKNLSGQRTTVTGPPINNVESPISVSSLLFDYQLNASVATNQYTGELAYLSGIVGNVETAPNNALQSCVQADSIGGYLIYGCSQISGGGWIIWEWSAGTSSSSVPINGNFIAECTIGGMSGDNLLLQSCKVIH